jgi:anti-sigma factor RsiW
MSETFHCDDKADLVAYLYDELDGLTRRRVDEHLRVCGACAAEVAGLSGVRRELAGWAPPAAALGFTIVPAAAPGPPAQVLRPARWWQAPLPGWAQAAAAVLVVAAGLSMANLQIRYGADGLVVTTGWMGQGTATRPAAAPSAMPASSASLAPDWQPALAALESSLRREIRDAHAAGAAAPGPSRTADLSPARVADLIRQSERRQQQELALRLAQFGRDLEVQRRSDLVRISQGFGQFEGRAGAEIARQRQMLDYIMRVSTQPQPK